MIFSYELEKKVLSGLLQHQHKWAEVSSFLKENDFYFVDSKVNVSIFKLIRNALDNAETIDDMIIIERLKQLKVSFPDSIDLSEYIISLAFYKITEDVFIASVKELKKFTARRAIYDSCKDIANFVKNTDPNLKYSEIVDEADKLYNKGVQGFESLDRGAVNLFDLAEPMIEERGNNPVTEFGLMGPHKRINEIYGSLLRGGNITIFIARAKVGKTSFCLDFSTKVSAMNNNVPILHFDNGEMSEEELIMRQMSAMTGLPMYLFETGKWRTSTYKGMSSQQVVELTRSTFKKLKGAQFYYENVAGLNAEEMVSLLKRFYYSKVGRGNKMIFSFDYIKSDFSNAGKGEGWMMVAKMVDRFKQCIHKELCFDGERPVSMISSVQANRQGITTRRAVEDIVEDESVISLSDSIVQFCSHAFLLRKKVAEELQAEDGRFGTHKLINLAARHLGEDAMAHLDPVTMPDGSKKDNFINLDFQNFSITEKGDLNDIVRAQSNGDVELHQHQDEPDIPFSLRH
jgi:replicative DNA helicase